MLWRTTCNLSGQRGGPTPPTLLFKHLYWKWWSGSPVEQSAACRPTGFYFVAVPTSWSSAMKKYLSYACALFLSSSVLFAPQAVSQDKAAQPPIKIAVGVDPSFAPFFVADAQGLFKKHGLNVEVHQYANGGVTGDAVVARSVELA